MRLGVITPSGVIGDERELEDRIAKKSKILKKYGLELVIDGSEVVYDDAKEKASQLEHALRRNDIDAVICYTGGFNANEVLPYLNFDDIKAHRKPIIGHSDISVLLNAIRSMTGCISFHFPSLDELCEGDEKIIEYSLKSLKTVCSMHDYNVTPSEIYQDQRSSVNDRVNTTVYENKGPDVLVAGEAAGRIIGGNISSFRLLEATPFFKPGSEDIILFIEDDDMRGRYSLPEFERGFEAITQAGRFTYVRGIALGRFQINSGITGKDIKKIVQKRSILDKVMVIGNLDFGHTQPNFVVPIGGWAQVLASTDKIEIFIKGEGQ